MGEAHEDGALRRTPLAGAHESLGAKSADFGGWWMPVEYAGGGVLAEHAAVRERVGLFDVSHLGTLLVTGPGAAELVDSCLTNDLARIGPGQAQYTLCCDERGGIVDDLIAYLRGPEEVLLIPNAANNRQVADLLREAAPVGVRVHDRHEDVAILAVQGPRSDEVLRTVGLPTGHDYLHFRDTRWQGAEVTVCRTGYTGERGYEVLVPAGSAQECWQALLETVSARDGRPCGLGARDTLRTEMGYPLHGHELSREITPVQARLAWAVGWGKPRFWGRQALLDERERGAERSAWGLLARQRGVPRPDMVVRDGEGVALGRTTSGTFSPTLGAGIALALLDRGVRGGDQVSVDVRGRALACEVVRPPFVRTAVRTD